MSMFNVFNIAGSAMSAQSARLNAVASNMANADSIAGPDGKPYRAKQVVFEATPMGSNAALGVRVSRVVEDASPPRLVFDPRSPAANEQGYVSITPLTIDMTAYDSLAGLGAWLDLQG